MREVPYHRRLAAAPKYALTTPTAGDADREAVLHDGRTLIAYYNCRACHRLEGSGGAIAPHLTRATLAPPSLEGEGARVQPSWLTGFLQRPTILRPWLAMRMPDYGLGSRRPTCWHGTSPRSPISTPPTSRWRAQMRQR